MRLDRVPFLVSTLLLLAHSLGAQVPDEAARSELRAGIERRMASNNIPGAIVGVVLRGEVVFLAPLGFADVELGVPVSDSSVFEIGSVSKQFLAAVTLQLVAEGSLQLDDPIHGFLTQLPGEWRGVTVRQLLNHTSGIPDYEEIAGYQIYDQRATPEEVIRIAHSRSPDAPAGRVHRYSNTGYYLLSLIVEGIEGYPLGEIFRRRIFDPLGMQATRMSNPSQIIPNRVQGYYQDRTGALVNVPATHPSATLGAGGLVSTVSDLARWSVALESDSLLSEEMKAMMWQPTILPDGRVVEYGFGWEVEPYGSRRQQYHYGMTHGFIANITRIPELRLTVIAMANRYREDLGRIVVPTLDLFIEALEGNGEGRSPG